ncbi:thioredoxin family protein [Sulfurovum sp. XGS-02]|uniref:thioredoxin family protein n=1 Tax=Sulfurovum sp. XGS-02 TaxID=2925411 RepID=UPI00206A332B|nr:thioredoxin family protein [Sulfurovum sp. XGS-02]UPT76936.1 thioredoxin family protein [Sulfurovum sp. XGS-02]
MPVMKYADVKDKIGNGKPLIFSFGMSHCYSCLAMSKVFAEVLEVHPEFQIYSIDGQKERLVSRDIYKLKEMPTQIFFDASGKEVFRHTGAYQKAVLEIILKKYGFDY